MDKEQMSRTPFLHQIRYKRRLETLRPRLLRVACGWCGCTDRADDLVQEASLRALKRIDQLKDPDAFDAWVFSIMSNCFRDLCRKDKSVGQGGMPATEVQPSAEEEVQSQQRIEQVRSAIGGLSAGQREVLILVDLEGFSYSEVATILSLPIGTVMSRLNRARERLRIKLLRREAGDAGNILYMERNR